MFTSFTQFHQDENGQGMTEYILLVVLVALTVAYSFLLFRRALRSYYHRVTYWVSLPIP
jgi:Flp pilus assembly pilin Flp